MRSLPSCLVLLLVPLAFTACHKAKVAVYQIPKEHDSATSQPVADPHAGMAGGTNMAGGDTAFAQASGAGLVWTAPADWRPKAGSSIRKGSYAVGPEDAAADCAVTAFPGDVGGDLANVNRWLGQLQQSPIAEIELADVITKVLVNGLDIRLVDLTGGTAEAPQRMLGAIVPFDNATWFFKLVGPDAVVKAQKEAFRTMIQSIHPAAAVATTTPPAAAPAAPNMADTAVRTADGPGLQWTAPAAWKSEPPSAMRKATYIASGDNGSTAELAVSAFPGDVGGELANVNRWRGQLQLSPLGTADLATAVSRLNIDGLAVTIVDFTNDTTPQKRLLGAIVPYDNATWFFKFTGPPELIEREKSAFLALVHSLHNS